MQIALWLGSLSAKLAGCMRKRGQFILSCLVGFVFRSFLQIQSTAVATYTGRSVRRETGLGIGYEGTELRKQYGNRRAIRFDGFDRFPQVIFDPGIGCYYDPKTNKYYTCAD